MTDIPDNDTIIAPPTKPPNAEVQNDSVESQNITRERANSDKDPDVSDVESTATLNDTLYMPPPPPNDETVTDNQAGDDSLEQVEDGATLITRTSFRTTEAARREVNDENAETRSSVDSVFGTDPPTGPRPILPQNFYRSAPVRINAKPEGNLQPGFFEKDAREFTTLHALNVDTKPKYYETGSLT